MLVVELVVMKVADNPLSSRLPPFDGYTTVTAAWHQAESFATGAARDAITSADTPDVQTSPGLRGRNW